MSPGAAPAAGLVPWWVTSRLVIAGRLACSSRHLGAGGNMRDAARCAGQRAGHSTVQHTSAGSTVEAQHGQLGGASTSQARR